MKLLLIGGSSFIGKNLIEKAPSNWNFQASYCQSSEFIEFVSKYPNVEPFHLDLMDIQIPDFGEIDVVLYLAAMGPGQATGDEKPDAQIMYRLHAEGVNLIIDAVKKCHKFIYLSSGVFFLRSNNSVYRKSRLLGEANLQAATIEKNINYLILRNMEVYGPYMAKHKIYRRLCESCISGETDFYVNGDGKNLLDTMYIDDYIKILIKAIKSKVKNEIVPFCRSNPVTLNELAHTIANTYNKHNFNLVYNGEPTEDTRFVLDNRKMIDLFGIKPETTLEQGLKMWYDKGLI